MKFASALVAVLVLAPGEALACSCAPPRPIPEAVENATRVFHGKVVAIEPLNDIHQRVTFQVTEHFKGAPRDSLAIETATSGAMCGYPFREGSTYVVYAHGDDSLATSSCSRTTLALSGSDLEVLRELSRND